MTDENSAVVSTKPTRPIKTEIASGLREKLFPCSIKVLFSLLPTCAWYKTALILRRALAPVYDLCRQDNRYNYEDETLRREWLLTRILEILTELARPFPIPYRIEGQSILCEANEKTRFLICSAHLPLANMIARAFDDSGLSIPAVARYRAAGAPNPPTPLFGKPDLAWACIRSDEYILVKARRALTNGSLMVMIDTGPGAYSSNLFHLAARINIPILFAFTELGTKSEIVISLKNPPYPVPRMNSEIAMNLELFNREVSRIRRIESSFERPIPADKFTE